MKNTVKSFTIFAKNDEKSKEISDYIRHLNSCSPHPLQEVENGDLILAVGGDGAFLHAVNETGFGQEKIYAGIHTGTLGFLQSLSENDIYTLVQYLHHEEDIPTREVLIPNIAVSLKNGKKITLKAFNEILICGRDYTKIQFSEYVHGKHFQDISANGIIVSSSTGDTAYSMNAGGAIDFTDHFQLVCTLLTPIKNAAYPDFIPNSIICSGINIVPVPASNIQIIIDGIDKQVPSEQIKSIEVSMLDDKNFINKLELREYSKVEIVRDKILGYDHN